MSRYQFSTPAAPKPSTAIERMLVPAGTIGGAVAGGIAAGPAGALTGASLGAGLGGAAKGVMTGNAEQIASSGLQAAQGVNGMPGPSNPSALAGVGFEDLQKQQLPAKVYRNPLARQLYNS